MSVNITNNINGFKNKNHMIILINTENAFDVILHAFMIKSPR